MEPINGINCSKRHFEADNTYFRWLEEVKKQLKAFQIKASVRVNRTLLEFYWSLGRDFATIKAEQTWGCVIEQMSLDLKDAFT